MKIVLLKSLFKILKMFRKKSSMKKNRIKEILKIGHQFTEITLFDIDYLQVDFN